MSLLSKAAKEVNQARKVRNAVVQVVGYELNEQGTLDDQILIAIDQDSGKEIRIAMGAAPTEVAAAQRTTIIHLAKDSKKFAKAGGYVKVDGLHLGPNGLYKARFVKTLKSSPEDDTRHFFKMKTRIFPAKPNEKVSYGERMVAHYARLELLDDSVAVEVKNSQELQNTVFHLLKEGSKHTASMGDNTVFFRDSPYAKIYAVRAKAVKVEGGGYRKPNDSELAEQISGMEIMKILGPALDANESATITVMPGASHVVVGKTASSNEYATQAEKFFSGTFKVADPETGELHNNNAAGFRQAIVSMTRTINPSGDIRWFVNNVSATLVDPLTMNGLEENAFIHKASGHEQGRSQEKNQAVPAAPQNNQAPIDGSQPQRSTTVESHQSMPAQQGNASYSQSPPPQGMPHSAPTNGMQQPAAQQQNAYQAQQSNAQGAVQTPPQDFLDNQPPLEHQEHDMGYGEQSIDDLLDQDAAQDEDLVARAAAAFEDLGTGPNM